MARRLESNTEGNFYVTTACINCDQCRQIAPDIFSEVEDYSAVTKQPRNELEERAAYHALVSCPTGAICAENKIGLKDAADDFPLPVIDNIFYCGYTSRNSWGASSYLIVREEGNWLVDAPRWSPQLARKFEELGGIQYIFLTHRDDVADAQKYANHFKAERIIHDKEKHSQPDAEHLIEGMDPTDWNKEFRIVPQPGHTSGHTVLLYQHKFLFTGDHLAWDIQNKELTAHRDVCWYSWKEQTHSMTQLMKQDFEWILPGHGNRVQLPKERMKIELAKLLQQMNA